MACGSEGHRIIAEIAEQYLEPNPAHQIRDLLAIENATTLRVSGNSRPESHRPPPPGIKVSARLRLC